LRLVWAQLAHSDRDDIFTHIEAENPRAAVDVDQQVAHAARRLVDFPEKGRPGRIAGTGEFVVSRTPYIAAYTVTADTVRILRVLHRVRVAGRDSHGVAPYLFQMWKSGSGNPEPLSTRCSPRQG
jgi:toxin ParE1/3/4